MTPEQAQELLRGDFASDAHQTEVGNLEVGTISTGTYIYGTPGGFALTEAAPIMAEQIASMHYEYAVQVKDEDWRTLGDAWTSEAEAQARYNATPGKGTGRVRIVRRLVGEPEVTS